MNSPHLEAIREDLSVNACPAATASSPSTRTETLLAELRQEAARKYRRDKRFRTFILSCLAIYAGSIALIRLAVPLHIHLPHAFWQTLIVLFKISTGVIVLKILPAEVLFWRLRKRSKMRFESLLKELSGNTRAVGAVAQLCLQTHNSFTVDIAVEILLKMLPCVKADDARYITESQMEALLALLVVHNQFSVNAQRAEEMPFAVLKALEQIGDSRAIEPVKRLTTGRGNWRYHKAAQECLRYLEQHGEERNQNRSLLLPSSLETGPDTLLRAANRQAEAQPEQLLRAAIDEERG